MRLKLSQFLILSGLASVLSGSVNALPAVHDVPKTKLDRYLVKDLPGYKDINKILRPIMYAGHITLHETNNTNYFFWKFEQKLQNTNYMEKKHDDHDHDDHDHDDHDEGDDHEHDDEGDDHEDHDHEDNNQNDRKQKSKDNLSANRLIFWLNGGPGCSSMDGALMEVGPLRLTPDGKVYFNNGTWLESGSLVFVDQPVGTGFSYGNEYHHDLTDVSWDFLVFLEKYFELFPNDRSKELYIAGESYAGQYIPYFAKYVLDHNRNNKDKYNLKGALIGNGCISASHTGLSYIPYAMDKKLISGKETFMRFLLAQQEDCQAKLNHLTESLSQDEKNRANESCELILNKLLDVLHASNDKDQCLNIYDVNLNDSYPSCGMNWPPDIKFLTPFLSDANIQAKLHLTDEFLEKEKDIHDGKIEWKECNNRVGAALTNDHSPSSEEILPEVLSQLPVVLFYGDNDLICNYVGTENFISDFTWNGYKGFSKHLAPIKWYYNDTNVGTVQQERNLTYVRVYNSSHMVPFDVPDISRGVFDLMVENFHIEKASYFDDKGSGNEHVIVTPVYNVSSSTYYYIHLLEKSRNHFYEEFLQFRYFVYLVVLTIIIYGLFYYNAKATPGPQSILSKRQKDTLMLAAAGMNILHAASRRKQTSKKKSVQWADLQRDQNNGSERRMNNGKPLTDNSGNQENRYTDSLDDILDDEEDIGAGRTANSQYSSRTTFDGKHSKFDNFLDKFGLTRNRDRIKYHQTSNFDLEEEIEMVNNFDRIPENSHNKGMDSRQFAIDDDDDDDEDEDDDDLGTSKRLKSNQNSHQNKQ